MHTTAIIDLFVKIPFKNFKRHIIEVNTAKCMIIHEFWSYLADKAKCIIFWSVKQVTNCNFIFHFHNRTQRFLANLLRLSHRRPVMFCPKDNDKNSQIERRRSSLVLKPNHRFLCDLSAKAIHSNLLDLSNRYGHHPSRLNYNHGSSAVKAGMGFPC